MAVLYWVNQGRLGNLLFQYAALLRQTDPDDRIYSFDNPVFELLETDPRFRRFPSRGLLARRIGFRVERLVRFAERLGFIGTVAPEPCLIDDRFPDETDRIVKIEGRCRKYFAARGFFQQGDLCKVPIKVRGNLRDLARDRLNSIAGSGVNVAVHVRLTDYGSWSILGVPGALIPATWYIERMNEIRLRVPAARFFVFSDDLEGASALGLGDDGVYYPQGSLLDDFAAISLCDHAIISPSTFAWWAALAHWQSGKIVMAPLHWTGFKSGVWFPSGMRTNNIEYYPVQ